MPAAASEHDPTNTMEGTLHPSLPTPSLHDPVLMYSTTVGLWASYRQLPLEWWRGKRQDAWLRQGETWLLGEP